MRGLVRLLVFALLVLMPLSASAQFVPIEQAKEQAAAEEQAQIEEFLIEISSKGSTARRQVQALLTEAQSGRATISGTQRKIDTIIGKLKTDLNNVVNDAAKKNLGGSSTRAVYNAAQQELNTVRRQAGETLDQLGYDKAANPKQLTGKYKIYQEKIKVIIDETIDKVDRRLADPGRRDTVRGDLEKLVAEAQKRIDISTEAFLSANPDVLPSALQRVKKDQLDVLSKAMADRFKAANERSNDKVQDLTQDELAAIEEVKAEMDGLVERAIATIDGLMQQVSAAGLPTSSQEPGVNPLLEAKFQAVSQVRQIRESTRTRLEKIEKRFMERTDMSQTAKDVFQNEYRRAKSRLNDVTKEHQTYFTAGDPSKKKYDEAKKDLQEEAEGCTSFFCSIGRAIGVAGSAVLGNAVPGLDMVFTPQTISGGILGISDGNPNAYRGAYSQRYGATSYGAGSQCFGYEGSSRSMAVDLGLVTVTHAQFAPDANVGAESLPGGSTGQSTSTAKKPNSNIWNDGLKTVLGQLKDPNSMVRQTIGGVMARDQMTRAGINQNCFGQAGYGGSIPGYGSVYNAPFGGYPVGYALGYNTNDLQLRGVTQDNYAAELSAGLQRLVAGGLVSTAHRTSYERAISILQNPGVPPEVKVSQVIAILRGTDFFILSAGDGRSQDGITNLFLNFCARSIRGNSGLVDVCRKLYTPTTSNADIRSGNSQQTMFNVAQQIRDLDSAIRDLQFVNTITQNSPECNNAGTVLSRVVQQVSRADELLRSSSRGSVGYSDIESRQAQVKVLISKFYQVCNNAQVRF